MTAGPKLLRIFRVAIVGQIAACLAAAAAAAASAAIGSGLGSGLPTMSRAGAPQTGPIAVQFESHNPPFGTGGAIMPWPLPRGLASQDAALPPPSTETAARYTGKGSSDGCGLPWMIEIWQSRGNVGGRIIRAGVEYAVYGKIAVSGRISAYAGKTRLSQRIPGPRFMNLELTLDADSITGEFSVEAYNVRNCETQVVLHAAP